MAVQNPFFGKREPEPFQRHTPPANGLNTLASGSAPAVAAPAGGLTGQKPQASSVGDSSGSKLTVGPNIKLKGVEITDCDTLVVEGTVEATMNSRVIQIAEQGAFKGSAEIDIAEVRGTFDGNLTVRQKLVIFSTGKVTGKIRYGKIVIEEGGQLSGEITFGTSGNSDSKSSSSTSTAKGEQAAIAA